MLEKTLESLWVCEEIKPVNPKGNQSWTFIGRPDAETKAPVLWPPDVKSRPTGKDPDGGKDWRQLEKGMTEKEILGWDHWLSCHEFEQAPGVGDGQGFLACCSPWGHKESDTTEQLNSNDNNMRVNVPCQTCSWYAQIGLEHSPTQIVSKLVKYVTSAGTER